MPDSAYLLSPEQKNTLHQLNSMIAYVNYATSCVLLMEMEKSPLLLSDQIDGFMLLSSHLIQEVDHFLDALTFSPGQHTNKNTVNI